jgi:O-acetyl-ADP-ribose deacetylase (regulator of RNase III)
MRFFAGVFTAAAVATLTMGGGVAVADDSRLAPVDRGQQLAQPSEASNAAGAYGAQRLSNPYGILNQGRW